MTMPSMHSERVQVVARQLEARPHGSIITIRKATPSHSVRDPGYKAGCHVVDVRGLTEILSIDSAARLATVEGQVVMEDLCKATFSHGLLPAVIPEFRKFTVAGLVNGEGIQSSSHRHGVFTNTLASAELLMADGTVTTASPDHNADLFAALPESLGTLGILTAAAVKLVLAKAHMRLSYRRFAILSEYLTAFTESLEKHDFHEGVIYGPNSHVLFTGDFVDDPGDLEKFDPWASGGEYYYQHVRNLMAARSEAHEVIETRAYLSRSERGAWWMLECEADFPLLSETTWAESGWIGP